MSANYSQDNYTKLSNLGIKMKGGKSFKTICPECSHTRKKKTEPCLSVNVDEGVYQCWNPDCGFKGTVAEKRQIQKKEPDIPQQTWNNYTNLPEGMVKWISENKGISQRVLMEEKITCESAYIPKLNQQWPNCITFNYFEGETVVKKKYRAQFNKPDGTPDKGFASSKNSSQIFYGYNDIKGSDELIIVEGEMEKLAFKEIDYANCVSVPNGAKSLNDYIDHAKDDLEGVKRFYIATDQDSDGETLSEELSRRLGKHKCFRVKFPDDCNDPCDVLVNHSKIELEECLKKAEPYPIKGISRVSDFMDRCKAVFTDDILTRGLVLKYYPNLSKKFSLTYSILTTITGIPGEGKSTFLDNLTLRYALEHDLKFGVFSFENDKEIHVNTLAEKLIGKMMSKEAERRMKLDEHDEAMKFIDDHFFYADPDDVYRPMEWEDVYRKMQEMVYKYGVNCILIDPFNKVKLPKGDKLDEINNVLSTLNILKKILGVHIFLVAHPTKMKKDAKGHYYRPSLYDIAHSSDFYNQTDVGIVWYYNADTSNNTAFFEKMKFKHVGSKGQLSFNFNKENDRYNELGSPDNMPWLNHVAPDVQGDLLAELEEDKFELDPDDVPF